MDLDHLLPPTIAIATLVKHMSDEQRTAAAAELRRLADQAKTASAVKLYEGTAQALDEYTRDIQKQTNPGPGQLSLAHRPKKTD